LITGRKVFEKARSGEEASRENVGHEYEEGFGNTFRMVS
jgi:hypothetical protein